MADNQQHRRQSGEDDTGRSQLSKELHEAYQRRSLWRGLRVCWRYTRMAYGPLFARHHDDHHR